MTRFEICKGHWAKVGIKNEETLKEYIAAIFEKHDHQTDVLIDLYKMILPDWDSIEKIDGRPEVGKDFWKFICNKFIDFDCKYHPKVFNGGIWLNTGFSADTNLKPWDINFDNCQIVMK